MISNVRSTMRRTIRRKLAVSASAIGLFALLLPAAAQASPPSWTLTVAPLGSGYFSPGATGNATEGPGIVLTATNVGTEPTTGTYTITDTLPNGVTPVAGEVSGKDQNNNPLSCGVVAQAITCTGSAPLASNQTAEVVIPVSVASAEILAAQKIQKIVDEAQVSGGGAASGRTSFSPPIYLTNSRPAWQVEAMFGPAALGTESSPWKSADQMMVEIVNVGGAATSGPITITMTMTPGVTITSSELEQTGFYQPSPEVIECEAGVPSATETTCTIEESIQVDNYVRGRFRLKTGPLTDGETVNLEVNVSGGGASDAYDSTFSTIDSLNSGPFDFLPGQNGLGLMLTGGDGLPSTQAGSHPGNFSVETAWPFGKGSANPSFPQETGTDGGVKDVVAYTPPGFVLNPRALIKLCTEAQLEQGTCPDESALGVADAQLGFFGSLTSIQTPLYALDPPYGNAAMFSFNLGNLNVFPHVDGFVRADGNYALGAGSSDILSFYGIPFFGLRQHFWADPTDPIHDLSRGSCQFNPKAGGCPVSTRQTKPLFSLPTSCGGSMEVEGFTNSWGHPEDVKQRDSQIIDSIGNPSGVTGCNALEFSPSVKARPTTNLADAPSGLDFEIETPQAEGVNTLATAHVKKTVVTLPPDFTINAAGANGLVGCPAAKVGIDPNTGSPNAKTPECPNASRIGTAEIDTPLLDHVMPGSVYMAEPYENPFNSLVALYVAVEDPRSGTLIKIAGKVDLDPATGQVTTTFDNQPQLPYQDLKLHLFGGATATLRTPSACGTYSSKAQVSPWSGNTPSALTDSYQISSASNGGTCPTSAAAEPNSPSFDAGTLAPVAGVNSPLVVNLRRPDGSQQFGSLTVTAPPGLLGKLAGIPACSDAALAAAAAKTGKEELANPSCPAASSVGVVHVGAGSGPAPYYTEGKIYLTGPYKGAPLGLAIVTPAVAGPFDLGDVVTRAAVQLDPVTAQITAVSDPIPTILKGVPLDLRSIQVKLDRPNFTINPTNCDPMSFTGQSISALGAPAALQSRFQLAECVNLGFKPNLALKLTGATKRLKNPGLVATLTARPGDANIAKARVRLPQAAFLDQDHIETVCTRVQFRANECPADSVYGSAEATSPLVDYTVKGPVYLRSSEHKVPDLVAKLMGPSSQPIEIDLAGTTDSVKGALRNTFEAVPDVPVSTFRLELFGGNKGLIELSRNLCAKTYRATIELEGQNGKVADSTPAVGTECKHKPKPKKHRRHRHRHSSGRH